jgi:phosphoribosylanthranilate isomerase
MTATKVKICGITCTDDALAAVDAGADAIGLIFYQLSKRCVEPDTAAKIIAAVGPFITTVGVFVNAKHKFVEHVQKVTGVHILQLHGDENSDYCTQINGPYIKAIRMKSDVDPAEDVKKFPHAAGYLFDSWRADQYGGTGESFEWHRITNLTDRSIILAGGLNRTNVREAIAAASPYAVDVSGGVEKSIGRKDASLMSEFVRMVKSN